MTTRPRITHPATALVLVEAPQPTTAEAKALAEQALDEADKMGGLVPQVLVTLSPAGGLVAELKGRNGFRWQIPVGSEDAGTTLLRILHAQLTSGRLRIGLDEAPTEAQIGHWENHGSFGEPGCPFCQDERATGQRAKGRRGGMRQPEIARHGSGADATIIRRFMPNGREVRTLTATNHKAADLFG